MCLADFRFQLIVILNMNCVRRSCGTVGKGIAYDASYQGFESKQRQIFKYIAQLQSAQEKRPGKA